MPIQPFSPKMVASNLYTLYGKKNVRKTMGKMKASGRPLCFVIFSAIKSAYKLLATVSDEYGFLGIAKL